MVRVGYSLARGSLVPVHAAELLIVQMRRGLAACHRLWPETATVGAHCS